MTWKRIRRGHIFTLDDDTKRRLEEFCKERKLNMSGVVEDAINLYIDEQRAREKQ